MRDTILAARRLEEGTAVNLRTMEWLRVTGAAPEVLRYSGHEANIWFLARCPLAP